MSPKPGRAARNGMAPRCNHVHSAIAGPYHCGPLTANVRPHKMPIDDCLHSFEALASTVLPNYLQGLRAAIRAAHMASEFARPGIGPVAIANELGRI